MKKAHCLLVFVVFSLTAISAKAQTPAKEIIQAMDAAAAEWNSGNLDGYMQLYDTAATMMMPQGRAGLQAIRGLYEKYYFENGRPKQILAYDTYQFTPLGSDYGLLTGRFILKANEKMKERSGTFSVILTRTHKGWKLLHDHSG